MRKHPRNYKLDHHIKTRSSPVKLSEELVTTVHSYGLDLRSNHIYLISSDMYNVGVGGTETDEPGVEFTMANQFIKNLNLCMRLNRKPILVHMNIPGGFWESGMAIYDAIKACPNPVTVLTYSHARSMSSLILQAANKKVMMPHAYFMFHEGSLGVEGTNKQVKSYVKFAKTFDVEALNIYATAMRERGRLKDRSLTYLKRWLQNGMDKTEEVYLSAQQAVELGLADEVFDYDWSSLTTYTDQQLRR